MPLSIPHPAFTKRPLPFSSAHGRPAVRGDRRSLVGYSIYASRESKGIFCFASSGPVGIKRWSGPFVRTMLRFGFSVGIGILEGRQSGLSWRCKGGRGEVSGPCSLSWDGSCGRFMTERPVSGLGLAAPSCHPHGLCFGGRFGSWVLARFPRCHDVGTGCLSRGKGDLHGMYSDTEWAWLQAPDGDQPSHGIFFVMDNEARLVLSTECEVPTRWLLRLCIYT